MKKIFSVSVLTLLISAGAMAYQFPTPKPTTLTLEQMESALNDKLPDTNKWAYLIHAETALYLNFPTEREAIHQYLTEIATAMIAEGTQKNTIFDQEGVLEETYKKIIRPAVAKSHTDSDMVHLGIFQDALADYAQRVRDDQTAGPGTLRESVVWTLVSSDCMGNGPVEKIGSGPNPKYLSEDQLFQECRMSKKHPERKDIVYRSDVAEESEFLHTAPLFKYLPSGSASAQATK